MEFNINIIIDNKEYEVIIYFQGSEFSLTCNPPLHNYKYHYIYADDLVPSKIDAEYYYNVTGDRLPLEIVNICNKILKNKAFI